MFEDKIEIVKLVLEVFHLLVVLLDIFDKVLDVPGHITGRTNNGNNARCGTDVSLKKVPIASKTGVEMASRLTSDLHARPNDSYCSLPILRTRSWQRIAR